MVFISKNVAVAALLVAPVIAAPLSQAPEDLERRGAGVTRPSLRAGRRRIRSGCRREKARKNLKRDYYDGGSGLEARGAKTNVFESREWDVELEERGTKTNIAAGAVGGYFIGKLWHKFRHRNDNKDAPKDAPVEARDLADFIYAREVLNRARALERRNVLENMIDELD
ncbi:hypothetical protein DFP72DRAFT_847398 [Ephemerocybe angulata]|uniref:Uncharacterized protein n=1 Tax=Ephemerocybe angulata TaxID=980116 RepID=A0A8H6HYZ2_9AGAR|nr:hypothetical protein DFP72DRAFT_847398 [Tulosesus angulatus]